MVRLLLLLCCLSIPPLYAHQAQAWFIGYNPLFKIDDVNFSFRQQYRFEVKEARLVDARFSLLSDFKLWECVRGAVNGTLINSRDGETSKFFQDYRLELEVDPLFNFEKRAELRLRNRYEIEKVEHERTLQQRLRQRTTMYINIDCKPLKAISIHNEIFYNLVDHTVDQDRFVPMDLTFAFGKRPMCNTYTMIRWLKTDGIWAAELVLGLTLDWRASPDKRKHRGSKNGASNSSVNGDKLSGRGGSRGEADVIHEPRCGHPSDRGSD